LRPYGWDDPERGYQENERNNGMVRIETGVEEGDSISPFYDPMIAKLIWHGEDRKLVATYLSLALGQVETWPVKQNAQFVAQLLFQGDFLRGRVHTGFIEEHADFECLVTELGEWASDIAAGEVVDQFDKGGPLGFRLNESSRNIVRMRVDGRPVEGNFAWEVPQAVRASMQVEKARDGGVLISCHGTTFKYELDAVRGSARGPVSSGAILAPMPGRIIAVDVSEGQAVTKGQKLLTLEAMKMEHSLTAPFDGTVAELAAEQGDQVQLETLLARIEPAPQA
jgi:3-methylcrotonyl-CoA carboxylase alpha subunit